MTDHKQLAIEAAVAAGFAPHDDHLRRMAKSGGVDVVELFEELGKALIMLNVPLSEVPAVLNRGATVTAEDVVFLRDVARLLGIFDQVITGAKLEALVERLAKEAR